MVGDIVFMDILTGKSIKFIFSHPKSDSSMIKLSGISGNQVVCGCIDRSIQVWDLKTNKCIKTLKGHTSDVISITKLNRTQLISGGYDRTIRIWDL